jgi:hypothetical protein
MRNVRNCLLEGDLPGALAACEATPGPVARTLEGGLRASHLSLPAIELSATQLLNLLADLKENDHPAERLK